MKGENEFIRQVRMEGLRRQLEHAVQGLSETDSNVLSSRIWSENRNHLGVARGEKDGKGVEMKPWSCWGGC